MGPHAFRATVATSALEHQADIVKVQEWLGHANISTTWVNDSRGPKPKPSQILSLGALRQIQLSSPYRFICPGSTTSFTADGTTKKQVKIHWKKLFYPVLTF